MATQRVELTNDSRQRFDTQLGDQLLRIDAWWQPSDRHWYCSVALQDGTALLAGRRLITGQDLFAGLVRDFSGTLRPHGLEDQIGPLAWGQTHELIYETA